MLSNTPGFPTYLWVCPRRRINISQTITERYGNDEAKKGHSRLFSVAGRACVFKVVHLYSVLFRVGLELIHAEV